MEKAWTIVCYDIRNAKRLRKIAKHMEGYGARLQFSIFRCHLSAADTQRLRHELAMLMEAEDSVTFVPLCVCCSGKVHFLGQTQDWDSRDEKIQIY